MEILKVGDELLQIGYSHAIGKSRVYSVTIDRVTKGYAYSRNGPMFRNRPEEIDGRVKFLVNGTAMTYWTLVTDENRAEVEQAVAEGQLDEWVHSFLKRATIEQKIEIKERYGTNQ